MIALDAADLVDLLLRDRLLVGNDRESLHHDVGQNRLLRLHGDVDKIIIIFLFRAHLIRIFKLHDVDAAVFRIIFFHHMVQNPAGRLRVMADRFCNPSQLHGISHRKKDCLDGCFRLLDRRGASCLTQGSFFIPVLFFHLSCPHCLSRLYTAQLRCLHPPGIQSGYPRKAPPG